MTLSGWVMLILTWSAILGLAVFCFCKVLSKKELS